MHKSPTPQALDSALDSIEIDSLPHLHSNLSFSSGRSSIFLKRGAPSIKSVIVLQVFCRKMHENHLIFTLGGGGGHIPVAPLGSPSVLFISHIHTLHRKYFKLFILHCTAIPCNAAVWCYFDK